MEACRKMHVFVEATAYFSVRTFHFKSANIQKMLTRMSTKDKDVFFCDIKKVDWEEYFLTYVPGIRVYLAKDPMETLPEGKRHWRRQVEEKNSLKFCSVIVAIIYASSFIWQFHRK